MPADVESLEASQQETDDIHAAETAESAPEASSAPEAAQGPTREAGEEVPSSPPAASEPERGIADREVAKLIRELRAARPESERALKALHDEHFAHNSYRELFPSVDEARTVKAALDAVGGSEGLANLQELEADIEETYSGIRAGDPAVLDDMIAEFPDGMKAILAEGVTRLAKLDPEGYRQALRRPLAESVLQSGLPDSLALIYERLQNGETDAALREVNRIAQWLQGIGKFVDEPAPAAARDSTLDRERRQLASERESMVRDRVAGDLRAHLDVALRRAFEPLWKDYGLSEEAKIDLLGGALGELNKIMGSDQAYQKSLAVLLRRGDAAKVAEFMLPKVDLALPGAVNGVWGRRYGSLPRRTAAPTKRAPAASAAPQEANGATARPALVASKPAKADIDYEKTTFEMMLSRQAILKSGKLVTWRRA